MNIFTQLSKSLQSSYGEMMKGLSQLEPQPKSHLQTATSALPVFVDLPNIDTHICLCIDTSVSMGYTDFHPTRLAVVQKAACGFVDAIREENPNTVISLIGFHQFSKVAISIAPVTESSHEIKRAIQNLRLGPATNLRAPIEESMVEFIKSLGKKHRVIMLTDGAHNCGNSPVEISKVAKDSNIQLDIIGFGDGDECDEPTLKKMASIVNGQLRYWLINSTEGLFEQFRALASAQHSNQSTFKT